jgi:hypothetical protein
VEIYIFGMIPERSDVSGFWSVSDLSNGGTYSRDLRTVKYRMGTLLVVGLGGLTV